MLTPARLPLPMPDMLRYGVVRLRYADITLAQRHWSPLSRSVYGGVFDNV